MRIQHAFIHIDVDDLGAVLHLLQRNLQSSGEIAIDNQTFEFGGAGDIAALAHIYK